MKIVALTGATGFVGGATLDRLLEAGWHVRALTRSEQPKRAGVTGSTAHWIYLIASRPCAKALTRCSTSRAS